MLSHNIRRRRWKKVKIYCQKEEEGRGHERISDENSRHLLFALFCVNGDRTNINSNNERKIEYHESIETSQEIDISRHSDFCVNCLLIHDNFILSSQIQDVQGDMKKGFQCDFEHFHCIWLDVRCLCIVYTKAFVYNMLIFKSLQERSKYFYNTKVTKWKKCHHLLN